MNRLFVFWGLIIAGVYLAWKHFGKKDDLQVHLLEEKQLQEVGSSIVKVDTAALNTYPITSIGDTPLAGIEYDPFNIDNPATFPKALSSFPGLINF